MTKKNYRRYACGCYHADTEVIETEPTGYRGVSRAVTLIRHRSVGEHDPRQLHNNADRFLVRAQPTDTWPARC